MSAEEQKPAPSKGSNRRFTKWIERLRDHPSVIHQIQNAVSVEMLEDILKNASRDLQASMKTRRRWVAETERQLFILRASPPKFETVPPAEGLRGFAGIGPDGDTLASVGADFRAAQAWAEGKFKTSPVPGVPLPDKYLRLGTGTPPKVPPIHPDDLERAGEKTSTPPPMCSGPSGSYSGE